MWGVDIRRDAINAGKSSYESISGHLIHYGGKVLPFEKNYFDVIMMFDVIEHLSDVPVFLGEVYRVLQGGGVFIFQTPNKITNIPWMMIEQKRIFPRFSHHCSLQTPESLKLNLIRSGFTETHIEKYTIITTHNVKKVRRRLGLLAYPLLSILEKMPLPLSPNLWGHAKKRE